MSISVITVGNGVKNYAVWFKSETSDYNQRLQVAMIFKKILNQLILNDGNQKSEMIRKYVNRDLIKCSLNQMWLRTTQLKVKRKRGHKWHKTIVIERLCHCAFSMTMIKTYLFL